MSEKSSRFEFILENHDYAPTREAFLPRVSLRGGSQRADLLYPISKA
jgi:hypothetical protein